MAASQNNRGFPLIQGLRALAALSVAFSHVSHDALTADPGARLLSRLDNAMPWTGGVDIFFVISGFVITYASASLFTTPQAPYRFLVRRLARVVPLYWVMTTVFLATQAVLPDAINGSLGGAGYILQSYLFIPSARPDGLVQPALGLGWTLNYEMFFYLVFTPFLCARRHQAVIAVCTLLTLLVVVGAIEPSQNVLLRTWSDPIVLEFCAGMGLALLPGRVVLPWGVRLALCLGAVWMLHLQPQNWHRAASMGVPAIALVAAATLGRPTQRIPRFEAWLVRLGDASYALYLVHPFAMRGVDLVWRHWHQVGGTAVYVVVSLALAQATALAVYRWFERPTMAFLRGRLGTSAGVGLARPTAGG